MLQARCLVGDLSRDPDSEDGQKAAPIPQEKQLASAQLVGGRQITAAR